VLPSSDSFMCAWSQRLTLLAGWRGMNSVWEQKKLEARKLLKNGADSHQSDMFCQGGRSGQERENRTGW